MMALIRTFRPCVARIGVDVAPVGTSALMSDQSATSVRAFPREVPDPTDPGYVAKLQQATNLANENCDRAMALAKSLSAQLREAQDRINALEHQADAVEQELRRET